MYIVGIHWNHHKGENSTPFWCKNFILNYCLIYPAVWNYTTIIWGSEGVKIFECHWVILWHKEKCPSHSFGLQISCNLQVKGRCPSQNSGLQISCNLQVKGRSPSQTSLLQISCNLEVKGRCTCHNSWLQISCKLEVIRRSLSQNSRIHTQVGILGSYRL